VNTWPAFLSPLGTVDKRFEELFFRHNVFALPNDLFSFSPLSIGREGYYCHGHAANDGKKKQFGEADDDHYQYLRLALP
jgi:hypothetical protein